MPTLWITVLEPPTEYLATTDIKLFLQSKTGNFPPTERDAGAAVFEVPFDFKADKSGVLQPAGPAIQVHGDKRRFVYLAWHGRQGAASGMFRRMKVYFDRIPGYPGTTDEYRVSVKGTDKRGGPACATVELIG